MAGDGALELAVEDDTRCAASLFPCFKALLGKGFLGEDWLGGAPLAAVRKPGNFDHMLGTPAGRGGSAARSSENVVRCVKGQSGGRDATSGSTLRSGGTSVSAGGLGNEANIVQRCW